MSNPTPSTSSSSQLICKVCAAPGGKHYGSIACLGCKGFFRRSVLLNKVYRCLRDKKCTMSAQTRNSCHYCRLQRCFAVGMKTTHLQGSRLKKNEKRGGSEFSLSQDSPTPPAVLVSEALNKLTDRRVSLGSLDVLKSWTESTPSADVIIKYFDDVENVCDGVSDESVSEMDSIEELAEQCVVDLDPAFAVRNPGSISPRVEMDWSIRRTFRKEMLKPIWCRLAVYFFDYASFMPDLDLLDPIERNRLILGNGTRILWLVIAYKTSKLTDNERVLSCGLGCSYPLDERADPEKAVFNEIARILYRECVEPMRKMSLSHVEYMIIKAIYFFSPVSNIGDRALRLVSRLRETYTNVLHDYLLEDASLSYSDAIERITRIHSLLQVIEVTSNRFDKRMAHVALFEMRGKLSYEIHCRPE